MKIGNVVEKHFIDSFNIDTNRDYEVHYEKGKNLITPYRMDIVPKICYLESIINNTNASFFEDFYKASIEVLSHGKYKEPGKPEKNTFEKYKEVFVELNNNIVKNGFDMNKSVFIKGNNNAILDGGHRAAIAYLNDLEIPYVNIDTTKENDACYNMAYFKKGCLNSDYLDYMCLDYVKRSDNIFVICLWGTLDKKQKEEAKNKIEKELNIIYQKDVNFNYNGLKNFMIEIYGQQEWAGDIHNKFQGIYKKVDYCYKNNRPMTFVVVQADNVNKIIDLKLRIRKEFNIGNHSVHSTDNKEETLNMLSILLNNNSINFLNNAKIEKYIDFYSTLTEMKNNSNEDPGNYIIYGDFELKMCGLKNNDNYIIANRNSDNNAINNYNINDLIYNPLNYFYYHGLKFLNFNVLAQLYDKGCHELKSIKKFEKNKKASVSKNILKIKKTCRKAKWVSVDITKKIGIYGYLKKMQERKI